MDAMEAILTRRSVRAMEAELPARELIEQVIEAGRCAPSGSNSRTTRLMVVTKPQALSDLRVLVRGAFARMEAGPDTYISLRRSIQASREGSYVYDYNAPVLIVTANRRGYGNALADSACVLENMMIAAHALGLGSCWINQLHWLDGDPDIRAYMARLGLEENETVTGGLILGYAKNDVPARKRNPGDGNPVIWTEEGKEQA